MLLNSTVATLARAWEETQDVRRAIHRLATVATMRATVATICLACAPACFASDDDDAPLRSPTVIVAVGAPGDEIYGAQFEESAQAWQAAAESAQATLLRVGFGDQGEPDAADHLTQLRDFLAQQTEASQDAPPLWIVLIGHGTYANEVAKFNLVGPDLSAETLREWLQACQRPLVIVNGASASGPFMQELAAPNRVIVTATRTGAEQNFARFGKHIAEAIGDMAADLDHDQAVSILEAFLMAAAKTQAFYDSEGRLATEHALLDDNGDGLGTPPEFFSGTRIVKQSTEGQAVDGSLARYRVLVSQNKTPWTESQRQQRDELEQQLEALRSRKASLDEDEYYQQLEKLFLELATLYQNGEPSIGAESSTSQP